jgi:hypothetical protein
MNVLAGLTTRTRDLLWIATRCGLVHTIEVAEPAAKAQHEVATEAELPKQ